MPNLEFTNRLPVFYPGYTQPIYSFMLKGIVVCQSSAQAAMIFRQNIAYREHTKKLRARYNLQVMWNVVADFHIA